MTTTQNSRILIFGNSGSGKSTLARHLAHSMAVPHLDLDTISWASPGVRKPVADSTREVESFMQQNADWVIEGCYGSLLEAVAPHCTELYFLNPGIETCLRHNRQRPWEPHKYESKQAQDKNLAMLQAWVGDYEQRDDEYSLQCHRRIFDGYEGKKQEYSKPPSIKEMNLPAGEGSQQ